MTARTRRDRTRPGSFPCPVYLLGGPDVTNEEHSLREQYLRQPFILQKRQLVLSLGKEPAHGCSGELVPTGNTIHCGNGGQRKYCSRTLGSSFVIRAARQRDGALGGPSPSSASSSTCSYRLTRMPPARMGARPTSFSGR